MATVTICSDFGAPKNKVWHCFHCFPVYFPSAKLSHSLWYSLVAQMVKNPSVMQETQLRSLGQKDSLEKAMATHSSILAWRIPWTVHGVTKSRTQLSNFHSFIQSQVVWVVKTQPANAEDIRNTALIPRSGRSRGKGNGKPTQYSCLENPMDRGVWQATVHGVTKSQTRLKWLSTT